MKTNFLLIVVSAVAFLTACASNSTAPKKIYTEQEHSKMTFCVGMSDTAMYVATQKLKGVPMEQMKNFYSSKNNARLNVATVEKVYAENFTLTWDYTVSFFKECAQNLAEVPSSRVNLAAYCMQNGLIADVAHAYKAAGQPKENAYAHFAKFKSTTPNTVVDKVYASSLNRAEIKLDVWNSCMAEISARNSP